MLIINTLMLQMPAVELWNDEKTLGRVSMMKNVLALLLSMILLISPALSMAESVTLEKLGIIVEVPEGWEVLRETDEAGTNMRSVLAIIGNTTNVPAESGRTIKNLYFNLFYPTSGEKIPSDVDDVSVLVYLLESFGLAEDYLIEIVYGEKAKTVMLTRNIPSQVILLTPSPDVIYSISVDFVEPGTPEGKKFSWPTEEDLSLFYQIVDSVQIIDTDGETWPVSHY